MNKTEIKTIANRIDRGQRYWKNKNETKFKRFKRYLEIKHWPDTKEERDRITVAYIHSIVRSKVPAISIRNPKFLVGIKKRTTNDNVVDLGKSITNRPNLQTIMDYLPDEIGMKRDIKDIVIDYVSMGMGIGKIGYEFEMEEGEEAKIMVDRFYVNRVGFPEGDFIFDPESTNGLKGARWCAEKMCSPLKDLQDNKFFSNTKDLTPNAQLDKSLLKDDDKPSNDEKRVEYWLYWEKNRFGIVNKYVYIVVDQNIDLATGDNPYKHGKWPYEELRNYNVPGDNFPIGDIEPIESQQKELDNSESILYRHMKKFPQKYKTKRGSLDSKAVTAMESSETTVVELSGDLSELQPLENPSVNNTVPLGISTIKQDMDNISGINEFRRGGGKTANVAATTAMLQDQGAKQRSDDALADIEDFLKEVGRTLMQLVQQYFTKDMLIQLTGDGSQINNWVKMTKEDIQGEFDLDVEPYSTAPYDAEREYKKAENLYNLLSKDPDLTVNARNELRRNLLEKANFKKIEIFMAKPMLPNGQPLMDPETGEEIPADQIPPEVAKQMEMASQQQGQNNGANVVDESQMNQQPAGSAPNNLMI